MKIQNVYLGALAAGAIALAAPLPAGAAASRIEYIAHLHAMNTNVTHAKTSGTARFVIHGGELTIHVKVRGAPPDMVHWQHFHGFTSGKAATCPTAADDANHDGIVDLIETGASSGTTMVPLIADPATMDVAHGNYPKADAKGDYNYEATVPLKSLDAAFAKAFQGQKLDLGKRVVFIHGVPADTSLPPTVASLGTIPAQVTLPIACGRIERVRAKSVH